MAQPSKAVQWSVGRRVAPPLVIMALCVWAVTHRVDTSQFGHLPRLIGDVHLMQFALAACLSALSLWAVARYDAVAHRHFRTSISNQNARISGFAAIAIAQTAGFGVFTGAAVRWRMLPNLSLATALKLSTFVAISFLLSLTFFTALVFTFTSAFPLLSGPAGMVLLALPLAVLAISFGPSFANLRHRLRLPSLLTISAVFFWTVIDVTAAAAALYILIPSAALSPAMFLPAFLLALGAAILSGAPGGVGPFELALFTLLPTVPQPELIAGIILYRSIYFAIPALIGVALVLWMPLKTAVTASQTNGSPKPFDHPELAVLKQNGGEVLDIGTSRFGLWPLPQSSVMLLDPQFGSPEAALTLLEDQAAKSSTLPCLYKCSAKTARIARQQGWTVAKISEEFVLNPKNHQLTSPSCRSLRRKLRKAEKSGIQIRHSRSLPYSQLEALDAVWQDRHGRAKGGSMGRFCPEYLSAQKVFMAYQNKRLVAFASFHHNPHGYCLDLMRHVDDLPDGTMHLLIQSAIQKAKSDGVEMLSLAAVPSLPSWLLRIPFLRRRFDNPGLRQFKACFGAKTQPRYAAARSKPALALCLTDIATGIHQPRPLDSNTATHNQLEDYEFA